MATRTLRFDLIEINLIVEVEAEDTILFRVLTTKFKTERFLEPEELYFIYTQNGKRIKESDSIRTYPDNDFVLTINPRWKSRHSIFSGDIEIHEMTDGIIVNNNTNWFSSFLNKAKWSNDSVQSEVFQLEDVITGNNKNLVVNVLVQYSINGTYLNNDHRINEKSAAIKKVLLNILNHELNHLKITDSELYNAVGLLNNHIQGYLTRYTELTWNTTINNICIMGFSHSNQKTSYAGQYNNE